MLSFEPPQGVRIKLRPLVLPNLDIIQLLGSEVLILIEFLIPFFELLGDDILQDIVRLDDPC